MIVKGQIQLMVGIIAAWLLLLGMIGALMALDTAKAAEAEATRVEQILT